MDDVQIAQTLRFIQTLFGPDDIVLVRPIEVWIEEGKKRSRPLYKATRHITAARIDHAQLAMLRDGAAREYANLFFGACPRAGREGFDLAWQIRLVRALWADLDDCTPDEARERCQRAGLPPPTRIICSGNGVHLYWLLSEPYLIDDAGDPPRVRKEWVEAGGKKHAVEYFVDPQGETVFSWTSRAFGLKPGRLAGIAGKIGGDHTTDLSRLLRLPGTWNRKDERNGRPPVLCEIVEQTDARYAFDQFAALAEASEDRHRRQKLVQVKLPTPRKISAGKQDRLDALINRCSLAPAGERSECDFALCCFALEKGIGKADLWAQVSGVGKFAERGEEYFDRTWASAEEHTRERILEKETKRSARKQQPPTDGDAGDQPASAAGASVPNIDQPDGRTDLANSRRFVAMHGRDLRFCHPWSKWLVWDGTRWKVDDSGTVIRMAKAVADAVWAEARDTDGLPALQHAVKTASDRSVKAMLSLAASDLPILPAQLDSNPWLFNCPNGTLDLRTGELREHRRDDFIMKLCPTKFDPEAASWTWDRFLEGLFESGEVIAFLQRLCGYAVTGDQREQILPILWGDGSNGKSTFLVALMESIGPDYTMQAAADLLMVKRGETHPTEKADLFGRRIVCCIESDEGRRLSEAFVKSITGGDSIRARRMREDFWEFRPTHTVLLATNYKPEVRGGDHAIWRRLALIPFTRTFWNPDKGETGPEDLRQDKTLPEKLTAEAEGILAWAVRGCVDWQSGGLRVPDEVRAATSRYQAEEDRVALFIEENCVTGASHLKVRAGQLYAAYKAWCELIGEAPLSMTKFGGRVKKRSGVSTTTSNGVWYLGLGIRDEFLPHD